MKENQSTVELDGSDLDLKTWFVNSVLQNKQGRLISQNNKKLTLYFDWNKSLKQKRNDKSEGIIVPIFEFEDASIDESKFKKVEKIAYSFRKFPRSTKVLYLNKDLKGKNTHQIITYIPIKGATLADYSGYTLFSDIKGDFLGGVVVKNNKVVGNITDTKKQKNLRVNCGSWETVEWSYWYIDGEGTFTIVAGSNTYFNDSGCDNTYQQDQGAPTNPNEGGSGDSNSGGDNSGGDSSGFDDLQSTDETESEETVYDDGSTKIKYFTWKFLQSPTGYLWSREKGTLVRNDDWEGPYWMFSSFEHVDTGPGGFFVGTVTIESAHASTILGRYTAGVSLAFSYTSIGTSFGIPITTHGHGEKTKYFSAN